MREGLLVTTPAIGYLDAWDAQRALADARRDGRIPDVVWLLEHTPTYTYGRNGTRGDLFLDDDTLAALGATCVATDRGGQMTWHGPGQTTGYAIVDLRPGGAVRRFVEGLVGAMVDAAGACGVPATTGDDAVGVYVAGRKLGSVGIRVSGGVTTHGVAFNRDPSLAWYARMTACGAPDTAATSLAVEGGDTDRGRVEGRLAEALGDRLGLALRPASLEEALGAGERTPAPGR
ncbi:MAG: lipoyl(octanoyl) transferase LipB [Actinomycetota bacterium]